MNSLYMGPEFIISHRYSQLIASFTVLFMYMGSFPIFSFVGVASFYVTYWLDKFLFLRYYQTPTRYPASVGLQATVLIPYAVVAHVILSLWAVSNSTVFETSHSEISYGKELYDALYLSAVDPGGLRKLVTQRHTVYLAMLLILIIIAMLIKWILHHFLFAGSRITQLLCFEFVSRYDFFFSTKLFNKRNVTISFPRAIRRGFIVGLDNYNILQNQRYKDAFHIDEEFSAQHRRVRSVLVPTDLPRPSGAPKPLPEDDVIASRALAMFEIGGSGREVPENTPRERRGSKRNDRGRTPRERFGDGTPRDGQLETPRSVAKQSTRGGGKGKKRNIHDPASIHFASSNDRDMPFQVVKGGKESRLVSSSYNVRIKQDTDDQVRGAIPSRRKHTSDGIGDLSSSGDGDDTDHQDRASNKPVVYATLSMKMLQARAEPEEVVQRRVLQRFESDNTFDQDKSYKYDSFLLYVYFDVSQTSY